MRLAGLVSNPAQLSWAVRTGSPDAGFGSGATLEGDDDRAGVCQLTHGAESVAITYSLCLDWVVGLDLERDGKHLGGDVVAPLLQHLYQLFWNLDPQLDAVCHLKASIATGNLHEADDVAGGAFCLELGRGRKIEGHHAHLAWQRTRRGGVRGP